MNKRKWNVVLENILQVYWEFTEHGETWIANYVWNIKLERAEAEIGQK